MNNTKQFIKRLVPICIMDIVAQRDFVRKQREDAETLEHRRSQFEAIRGTVTSAMKTIRELDPSKCRDVVFLEK